MFAVIFFLFSSIWLWKILLANLFLGLALVLLALLIRMAITKSKERYSPFLLLLYFLILFLQFKTTRESSLTELSNDEIRVRDMRLTEYPPSRIPVAWWLEGRKESIAARRITDNFFQTLDINQYFFAGHPRERVGVKEFEKFPYIFLPFFVIGVINLVSSKKYNFFYLFFFVPIFLLSFIGHRNLLGPFSLFPFFVTAASVGLKDSYFWFKKFPLGSRKIEFVSFVALLLLVFIQIISYEVYR